MRLSRITSFILFAFVQFFNVGCQHAEENAPAETYELKVVPVQTRIVSPDSSMHPVVIPIDESKLKHSTLLAPQSMNANMNIRALGEPVTVNLRVPETRTPGTDTFALPEVVPAMPTVVPAKQPVPVTSLPLRMKDQASHNIQYLDVEQGMNSSYIWDIFEDKAGNFWFATDGGGVTRYDGKTFLHFTEEHGLVSNYVRKIIQDKHGYLWFATINGLSCYNGFQFINYTKSSGLKHNSLWWLLEDTAGNIWLSTYGGGASKFDGKNFTHYTTKQGLSSNMVWTIFEDVHGFLYFGTNGGGLCSFDGNHFSKYSIAQGLPDSTVLAIHQKSPGVLLLGTQGGLVEFRDESVSTYTTAQGLPHNTVRSIYTSRSGQLWLGTYGNGAVEVDDQLTLITSEEGLSDGHIVSMEEDETGNIWFATYGGGVCKYNPGSFHHYTNKQNLSNFFVWSIAEDTLGRIWYGTNGGGVIEFTGDHYTTYTTNEGLCGDVIRTVCCASDGTIWFGSYGGGVTRLKGIEITNFSEADGLCNNNVLDIEEDRSGNIWISTDGGGVSVYDGKSFSNYGAAQGLPSNYIRAFVEDSRGIIWMGAHAGLCSYDPVSKNITRYNENNMPALRTLWCAAEDNYGDIWFGTGGYGALRFNGSTFTFIDEKAGLSNNSVWSMVLDREGRMWMGTEKGLNRVRFSEDSVRIIYHFHREDGLKAEDFYLKSALLDSRNQLWWGTGKALTVLDMNSFQVNETAPHVRLNNIFVRDEFVDFRELSRSDSAVKNPELRKIRFQGVEAFEDHPVSPELPWSLNHLTFYFSATDWSAPHAVKYQYKLEGLDPDWSQLTSENKADYRNIPYGHYTFKVRAIGSAGKWSNEVEYPFDVDPPWWHTWWARTLGVAVVIALIVAYIRWRTRVLRARQIELKRKVNEATYEIKQQKHLVEEKHKAITDSINYAERIQRSFLATKELLDSNLHEYFVLYLPKDVVSGDFYWASKLNNGNFALVTADSTGHGVPGAIMSLLNITSLEKAIEHETDPAEILNITRRNIIERLSKDGTKDGGWDGMDCSLISFDFAKRKMRMAAANNPVWIFRDGVLHELKADRFPVGKHEFDGQPFTNNDFELQKGDVIYTMTDGYADQFGGPLGKKFKWKQLQKVLQTMVHDPMPEQHKKISAILHSWKTNLEQIDDICLIGIRITDS